MLEKIAAPIAPFVVGRTGKQLFLTDGKSSDPPLLLRMASDCTEGPFMYVIHSLAYPVSNHHYLIKLQQCLDVSFRVAILWILVSVVSPIKGTLCIKFLKKTGNSRRLGHLLHGTTFV